MTRVIKDSAPSTACRVRFSDGSEREYPSLQALQDDIRQLDDNGPVARDIAQRMCIAFALARSPTLDNVGTIRDRAFNLDLANATPIRVQ